MLLNLRGQGEGDPGRERLLAVTQRLNRSHTEKYFSFAPFLGSFRSPISLGA